MKSYVKYTHESAEAEIYVEDLEREIKHRASTRPNESTLKTIRDGVANVLNLEILVIHSKR